MPDIEEVADELYGLPPEEFTAARTRFEKEAKAAGDREVAARIHAFAKPTVTAWLANQLVREHGDEVTSFLQLGAGLREATRNLAGDELRALSRQRNELVNALVEHARELARAAGRSVTEDVARALADTLHAALADEDAANLLVAGRLTDALHSSEFGTGFGAGFGGGSSGEASNVVPLRRPESAAGNRAAAPPRAADDERRVKAEQDLADAQRALADAIAARDEAQAASTAADNAAIAAHEFVEQLRQQLEEATAAAAAADRARREQAGAVQQAERFVRGAERRRDDAQARHDRS